MATAAVGSKGVVGEVEDATGAGEPRVAEGGAARRQEAVACHQPDHDVAHVDGMRANRLKPASVAVAAVITRVCERIPLRVGRAARIPFQLVPRWRAGLPRCGQVREVC